MYKGHGEIYILVSIYACTHAPISMLRLSARQMQPGDCSDDDAGQETRPGTLMKQETVASETNVG